MVRLTSLCFIMSCCAALDTAAQQLAFDSQAHRGGRGLMPENTIPAMLDALSLHPGAIRWYPRLLKKLFFISCLTIR